MTTTTDQAREPAWWEEAIANARIANGSHDYGPGSGSREACDIMIDGIADELEEMAEQNADAVAAVARERDEARTERDAHLRTRIEYGDVIANHCIAMQAAVVASSMLGPDVGMTWIVNTLRGPGLLPDMEVAARIGGAQPWFDAKMGEHEAFRRANLGPSAVDPRDAVRMAVRHVLVRHGFSYPDNSIKLVDELLDSIVSGRVTQREPAGQAA